MFYFLKINRRIFFSSARLQFEKLIEGGWEIRKKHEQKRINEREEHFTKFFDAINQENQYLADLKLLASKRKGIDNLDELDEYDKAVLKKDLIEMLNLIHLHDNPNGSTKFLKEARKKAKKEGSSLSYVIHNKKDENKNNIRNYATPRENEVDLIKDLKESKNKLVDYLNGKWVTITEDGKVEVKDDDITNLEKKIAALNNTDYKVQKWKEQSYKTVDDYKEELEIARDRLSAQLKLDNLRESSVNIVNIEEERLNLRLYIEEWKWVPIESLDNYYLDIDDIEVIIQDMEKTKDEYKTRDDFSDLVLDLEKNIKKFKEYLKSKIDSNKKNENDPEKEVLRKPEKTEELIRSEESVEPVDKHVATEKETDTVVWKEKHKGWASCNWKTRKCTNLSEKERRVPVNKIKPKEQEESYVDRPKEYEKLKAYIKSAISKIESYYFRDEWIGNFDYKEYLTRLSEALEVMDKQNLLTEDVKMNLGHFTHIIDSYYSIVMKWENPNNLAIKNKVDNLLKIA